MVETITIKLKSDIESAAETVLATREIESLCGVTNVKVIGGQSIPEQIKSKLEVSELGGKFIIVQIDGTKLQKLDRLAYAEWFLANGVDKIIPQQANLEFASISAAGGKTGENRSARRHREYLSHGIHKYKAKFFPRFARSLINICSLTENDLVLDPFSGSGTTALEAGLMGLQSISNDIDPLSCLISRSKVRFPLLPASDIDELGRALKPDTLHQQKLFGINGNGSGRKDFVIPEFLRSKLEASTSEEIERQVNTLAKQISPLHSDTARSLGNLLISHAVSTKISLRWVGTGDNRFALEVAARDIQSIANSHFKRIKQNHPSSLGLVLPETAVAGLQAAQFINSSATKIDIADESVDSVVTSPPYLPASSGRETYLRSRAPGLIALELLSEKEIHELDADGVIGSVLRKKHDKNITLPRAVIDLVDWMQPQRARSPKAEPTLVYFQDLGHVGKEMYRVLKTGGKMAVVVATSHTFYELVSRDIVRTFPLAEILADYFTDSRYGINFSSAELIEIELPKMDYAARPGSRHRYSETAIIFRK